MTSEDYQGRRIKVVSFDDATSGEYVIEFIDPVVSDTDSVIAVFNRGQAGVTRESQSAQGWMMSRRSFWCGHWASPIA